MKHRYIRPTASTVQLSSHAPLAHSGISIYNKELGSRYHSSLWDDDDMDTDMEETELSVTFK